MAIRSGLYKGFSSFEFQSIKTFKLRDIELVKMDLLNHIFTRRGERVMMPKFGTSVPDMVFEPLTFDAADIIKEEIFRVLDYDPRVEPLDIEAYPEFDTNSVMVTANVLYVELNMTDTFELNIEFEAQ